MKRFPRYTSINLKFWHYQSLGFTLFVFNELSRNWEFWMNSWNSFAYLIFTLAILFLLTLGLRFVYRYLYKLQWSPALYILAISITSCICAMTWQEIRLLIKPALLEVELPKIIPETSANFIKSVLLSAWTPFVWSILYFGIKYWQDLQEERERYRVSLLLATKTQLQILRSQINPHFLFNSLNSIKALTYENPEQAAIMLTELSEFLRSTLNYNEKIFVKIKDEIEIITKYLAIEKIRFEKRLDYQVRCEPILLDHEILCFITQPLVENAIKHGLENNPLGITLDVSFSHRGRNLAIVIGNSGQLRQNDSHEGKGISNVTERLRKAYGEEFVFSIREEGQTVKVEILIPFKL